MNNLEFTDAEQRSKTHARVSFRFPVLHEYLNHAGDLHGGSLGMIFDIVASWPMFLIASPDLWPYPGVTRRLSYTLLSPVKEGEMVLAEGETVHVGKRLALLMGVLKRERDGAIVATCEHERYNTIPPQMKSQLKL
ncbi:hypothetical protein M409DRAFT_54274 [Zasmidium cellare ATCC 36951]|uniref:Thioesterase domain-containing protein n=1 Tax=Zasmidium cellare ATCC 36951 TaxID=1080233 RepID=A0A6A6CMB3_ZASCE|nr:uncharacterized protein M409DRAFT_54274 [Zasmidium cellare ATCC 36951]KAF2167062.1 hypothetical protein M409DRAFT_54274 [Zasmidium cellare ATCC 36951]